MVSFFFISSNHAHCPQLPTSHRDLLVGFFRSPPATQPATTASGLVGWLFSFSRDHAACCHHQRAFMARWCVFHPPPPSTTQPATTTNGPLWLVGGHFPLSLGHTSCNHHTTSRASTTTNEPLWLVGGALLEVFPVIWQPTAWPHSLQITRPSSWKAVCLQSRFSI